MAFCAWWDCVIEETTARKTQEDQKEGKYAQHTIDVPIPMRVSNTRGALPFHRDLTKFYSKNHGGLNEWDPEKGAWVPRGLQHGVKRIVRDVDGELNSFAIFVDFGARNRFVIR